MLKGMNTISYCGPVIVVKVFFSLLVLWCEDVGFLYSAYHCEDSLAAVHQCCFNIW